MIEIAAARYGLSVLAAAESFSITQNSIEMQNMEKRNPVYLSSAAIENRIFAFIVRTLEKLSFCCAAFRF